MEKWMKQETFLVCSRIVHMHLKAASDVKDDSVKCILQDARCLLRGKWSRAAPNPLAAYSPDEKIIPCLPASYYVTTQHNMKFRRR
mmetsp:Transcript_47856/g.144756  ORF Transcript_47856/g.144756 Transcript_47856/m.144756 type:complete len:86 (-) Transcript_47856:26-283(-)